MNIDVDSPNLKGNLDTWDYSFSSDIVTEIWQDKNIWWRKKSLHSKTLCCGQQYFLRCREHIWGKWRSSIPRMVKIEAQISPRQFCLCTAASYRSQGTFTEVNCSIICTVRMSQETIIWASPLQLSGRLRFGASSQKKVPLVLSVFLDKFGIIMKAKGIHTETPWTIIILGLFHTLHGGNPRYTVCQLKKS